MKSSIIPDSSAKLANGILKEYCPRTFLGVQAITANPEFSSKELYAIRTDLSSAFEHVTREMVDKYVYPNWKVPEDKRAILDEEYENTFQNGVLKIGSSLSPRIFEDLMDKLGYPQKKIGAGGSTIYRYVDDIILFNERLPGLSQDYRQMRKDLEQFGFSFSLSKTGVFDPGEQYTFLGREFHGDAAAQKYLAPAKYLPNVYFFDDSSCEKDREIYLNKRYLKEFYTSTTLNGYVAWAAVENKEGKSPAYDYPEYLGHSRIYNYYVKNIKSVYEDGEIPDPTKAARVLMALSLHVRELRNEREIPLQTWLQNNNIDFSLCDDAQKQTPYHKLIKTLFKEEYQLRNPTKPHAPER